MTFGNFPRTAWLLAGLLAACLPAGARAQNGGEQTLWLDSARCVPCPTQMLRTLPPAWREYWHFVQLCPVTSSEGRVALQVMTPRIDLATAAAAGTRERILGYFSVHGLIAPPSLYLVDSHANLIGEIATRFPLDPPYRVTLGFSGWQEGFPTRVEVRREMPPGGSAGGSASPRVFVWDPLHRWFRPQPAG